MSTLKTHNLQSADSGSVNIALTANAGMIVTGISTFSNDIVIPDKIIHSGDTNTAIRFPSDNTITAETSGVERFRIRTDGKIGFGTDMAGAPASNYAFGVYRASGTGYLYTETGQSSASAGLRAKAGTSDFTIFTTQGTGQLAVYDNTNSAERLRIASDGKVGIGTDNPVVQLHILSSSSGLKVQRGNESFSVNANYGGQSHCAFELTNALSIRTGSGAQNERFRITNTGKVGIGTNAPSQIFNICGTNVKPVIGHITAHTPLYSSYDSQNNTSLEISSSGTGTNVAGLTINNPTTSVNTSYKTISFSCSGTSSSEKRGCIVSSNHDLDSSSAIKANFKVMVNNGSGLQNGLLIGHQGHVQTSSTAMFSARGQNASWSSFASGSGWFALGDTTTSGSNYTHNHAWTTSGTGCAVRGLTNAGNSIWNNSTAVFTAPVDGFYNFEISLYIRTNGGGQTMHVQPWVGGSNTGFYTSNIGNMRSSSNTSTGDTQEYPHVARSINLYLTNGQTFYWLVYAVQNLSLIHI